MDNPAESSVAQAARMYRDKIQAAKALYREAENPRTKIELLGRIHRLEELARDLERKADA